MFCRWELPLLASSSGESLLEHEARILVHIIYIGIILNTSRYTRDKANPIDTQTRLDEPDNNYIHVQSLWDVISIYTMSYSPLHTFRRMIVVIKINSIMGVMMILSNISLPTSIIINNKMQQPNSNTYHFYWFSHHLNRFRK